MQQLFKNQLLHNHLLILTLVAIAQPRREGAALLSKDNNLLVDESADWTRQSELPARTLAIDTDIIEYISSRPGAAGISYCLQ